MVDVNLSSELLRLYFQGLKSESFLVYTQVTFESSFAAFVRKSFVFYLRVPLLLRITSGFHSNSSCFKQMKTDLKPQKFSLTP